MSARLDGYDIYHGNAIIDIGLIPPFPVIAHKLTEGATAVDPLCGQRLPLLRARAKFVYMWLRPDSTADAQVANFQRQVKTLGLIDTTGALKPGFGVMIDWEKTYDSHGNPLPMPTRALVDQAHALLHGLYGDRVITYSAPWVDHFLEWRHDNPTAPFWLADYTAQSVDHANALGATCTQFTNHAVIAGLAKPVDGNMILRQDVLDRITGLVKPPVVAKPWPPLPHPLETDMANVLFTISDAPDPKPALFAQTNAQGAAIWAEWTGDGNDPRVQARIANHHAAGMTDLPCTLASLGNCTLIGPVPPGVDRNTFAKVVGG